MNASLLFYSKITLVHKRTDSVAIAELKVWLVPKSMYFPEGIKYSLFLVNYSTGEVLMGYDNHKPKGHHIHIGDSERAYVFVNVDALIAEFWLNVECMGYLV